MKNQNLKNLSILFLLFVSPFVVGAAKTPEEAVFMSLETNPEVQMRWHTFQSAGFDTQVARGGYFPSIDATAGSGRQSRDFDGRGNFQTNRIELSLTQMLFDGFKTRSEVEGLEKAQQVRLFELLGAVDDTALEALRAYDDVQRYRTLLDLTRLSYDRHLEIESQIRAQVGQGVARGADLSQVTGRVARAKANLLSEVENLHDVTSRYLRVVGELPANDAESLELRYGSLPSDVQDVLYAAYQGNSSFHAAIKNIEVAQSAVKIGKADYFPKVELRASTGLRQNMGSFYDDRFDSRSFGNDAMIELSFTYNLYRGGADRATISNSIALVDEARSQRDQACNSLRQTVQIAYNHTQRIQERLDALTTHRDSSDRVRRANMDQFKLGLRTLQGVLDSENEYFAASRSLIEAQHERTMAHVALMAATGELLPALNISESSLMFLGDNGDLGSINVDPSSACPTISPRSLGLEDLVIASYSFSTDVLFDSDQSILTTGASNILDQLIADLTEIEGAVKISINGHSDNSGVEALNIPLSQERAKSVRDYLLIQGRTTDFIEVNGYGSSQPLSSNDTDEGRRLNRRVEVIASIPERTREIINYVNP